MKYTPDVWEIIEITYPTETLKKILAGWYGGYTGGDSWKLSSGVESTEEFEDRYEFTNYSGSVYICYKNARRLSGLTSAIYNNLETECMNRSGYDIKLCTNILG